MRCEQVRSRLAIHADGDLRGAALYEVELHLDACSVCQGEFAAVTCFLQETREALASHEPAYSFAELQIRMDQVEPLDGVKAFLPKLHAQGPLGQFAATAVLLTIMLATPLLQRFGRQTYTAAKSPFDEQLARLDKTYEEYLDEDLAGPRRS